MINRDVTRHREGRESRKTRRSATPGWYLGRPYAMWRKALDVAPSPVTCVTSHSDGSTTWAVRGVGGEGS